MKSGAEGIQMSQKSSKTAAELESILIREGAQIADECEVRLAEITSRLRKQFDLAE